MRNQPGGLLGLTHVTQAATEVGGEVGFGVKAEPGGLVLDFAATNALLGVLGFTPKSYQETRRTSFILDGARVEIDTWPQIPPYLEIEAGSKNEVVRVAGLLGYPEADLTGENTIKIYARYGIDLNTVPALRF